VKINNVEVIDDKHGVSLTIFDVTTKDNKMEVV
jgi:hypothetical protein